MQRLRLSRGQRMQQTRDFARARSQGRRLAHGCLVANWIPAASGHGSRLGVIASRKVGKAVERNRARRLLKESFRLHQRHLLHTVDLVLVARPSIVGKSFQEVERAFLGALHKAGLIRPGT